MGYQIARISHIIFVNNFNVSFCPQIQFEYRNQARNENQKKWNQKNLC